MKFLILILLLALLFISQINTIVDVDLWLGLKTGEHIVKNLEIPRADIFSYTLAGKPWIDHEWLSQVLFYLVFSGFGWPGLNILKAFIIAACFFILFFLSSRGTEKTAFPLFFLLLSILAFGYRSFVRPEIFSYLLMSVFLYILEKDKPLYAMPFLQILWVNLHGYFIVGPALILLYLAGGFLSGDKTRAGKLVPVFILSVAACFINPYFYKGALYPLGILIDAFSGQRMFMRNIHELMMPIRLNFFRFFFFWVLAILSSLTFIVNIKNVKARHMLVFVFAFISAYLATRNIPVFIFPAMLVAGINLNNSVLTKGVSEKKYHALSMLLICGLIVLFLSNKYYAFTNQDGMRRTESKFSELLMPEGTCDFLERNDIKGPVFNTLDFGPYIGYRFYPEKRIFIDTRTELYKDEFYRIYRRVQNYPAEWKALRERYGFNIAIVRHLFSGTERLLKQLYKNNDWRLVYYDKNSCVFLRDMPAYKDVIRRYEVDFKNKRLADSDIDIHIARFFAKIGEPGLAEEAYERILARQPAFLEAGNNLAALYIDSGRYKEAINLLQNFLDRYPGSAELYANIGTAYMRSGENKKGLSLLEKAARLNPYLRKASYMLGIAYLEKGEFDRALRQFVKYSRLDPYDPGVHRMLGDIYRRKGLLKEADVEYNEANALES